MKRDEFYLAVNRYFDLLGNPLRFMIYLKILKDGCDCDIESQEGYTGNCVTAITKELDMPQSTVSTYLKDLIDAGLIECKKNGKFLYCKPNKDALIAIKSFTDSSLAQIHA